LCAVEYAIPREKIEKAKARDEKYGQSNALIALFEIAKQTFTHLKNSGEGSELLVFLLAERFLKLPQVLCKMDLKTASGVHFHGCDGVYAQIDGDKLALYWGGSRRSMAIQPAQYESACPRSRHFSLKMRASDLNASEIYSCYPIRLISAILY
jgi:hypothetical protein